MEQYNFAYQTGLVSQLPPHIQDLVKAAEAATQKSYAPYSRFNVGAAVLLTDGTVMSGSNHENASFPAGICAERSVLGYYDMNGPEKITAIAIAYRTEGDFHAPLSPCGLCRQTLLEVQLHQDAPIAVYMTSPDGNMIMVEDARFLLPFFFSNDFLPGNADA